jgi:hypothetical protein
MGDGTTVEMTRDELRADIEDGVAAAVKRARLTELENECVGEPTAMEAKFNIAELLDLPINCVERFRGRVRSLRGDHGGAPS